MKKLSDYKNEEAIDLWADLLEPLSVIFTDEAIKAEWETGSYIKIAKTVLKTHAKEATEILLRIDDTPIDGMNILIRLVELFSEIGASEYAKSFFGFAEQVKQE